MINNDLTREQSVNLYYSVLADNDIEAQKILCTEDLFYLLFIACQRKDVNRDWIYERVREVEAAPDGHLDLWARFHYKSTIQTFANTLQAVLKNSDITVGIFSHTKPIAKAFLDQIKREFERNHYLQNLFPEILYSNPQSESPKWTLDTGIIVKRKGNPKEATVEAHGLVDGQPTSRHFQLLVYDDVVTRESVTTPEQIKKVTSAWELSLNLGTENGRARYTGTRYAFNDTYATMMERGSVIPRIHAATDDGTKKGNPVLLSVEELEKKKRDLGVYTFSCQLLLNPVSDKAMGFKKDWLQYYDQLKNTENWNYYIIVDPANTKKKHSDYTVMAVIALAPDNNYYLIDGIRDRLNLTERTQKLFEFHRRYHPLGVGYEHYGMQADISHIEYVQEQENYRFYITPLAGKVPKNDRILRLVPLFQYSRFYLPHVLHFIDYEERVQDFVQLFVQHEYLEFPVSEYDDMLDCVARIIDDDLDARFPELTAAPFPSELQSNQDDIYMTDCEFNPYE
ncbi:MAG: hypothetical protein K9M56_04315 [Victivallales bacterium]|nr:hypothetical protein [Victivallales bacterium]